MDPLKIRFFMASGREVTWEYKDDEDSGADWGLIKNTLIDLGLYNLRDWEVANRDPRHCGDD